MKPMTATTTKGSQIWDAHAVVYEQVFERSTSRWGRDALVLGQLSSRTASASTPRLLDVACGTGEFALAAAAMGFAVTATDFSSGMVARVDAKLASNVNPLKVTTRVVDGQTLEGLDDASFDVVSSIFGACMFPDRAAAWRNARRVLTPGGQLLVTSWDAASVNVQMMKYMLQYAVDKPDHVRETLPKSSLVGSENRTLAAASFREELQEFGFHDVHVHSVRHAMCFESGQELVKGVLDNGGFMTMAGHKQSASLQVCVLDFVQLVLDGIDPFAEDNAAKAKAIATKAATVESHPLWDKAFAINALGHIAIATKPLE